MKNSIQCRDLGRLDVSFPLIAILPASAPSKESLINSSSAAVAVAEALALCFVLNAGAAERPEKE
jgi:hypothetical protein